MLRSLSSRADSGQPVLDRSSLTPRYIRISLSPSHLPRSHSQSDYQSCPGYASETEHSRRAAVYEANQQVVRYHNAAADVGNHTFWVALNARARSKISVPCPRIDFTAS